MIAVERGDAAACRSLVDAFLPAIASLARGFQNSRVERGELLQEGVTGLLLAARRYDPSLDTPFWAYASFWVRKGMQELVAELTRPVALSDRAARELARVRAARDEHLRRGGGEPTPDELSAATGLAPAQLESLLVTERMPRGLAERWRPDDPVGQTIADTLVDPDAEQAYEQVLDDLELRGVLDLTIGLEERERTVIRSHYGLGQERRTLAQIGAGLGLTAERARQIESAALSKLRQALTQPPATESA